MIYSYQAKDGSGRTVTGSLDAPDEHRAAQEIRDMGYFPMRLAPQSGGAATLSPLDGPPPRALSSSPAMPPGRWVLAHLVYPLWSGVKLRDMAMMYRQFSAMIHAGVPIYQCLTTLVQQTSNSGLRKQLQQISTRVQNGEMLTEAMAEFPWVFTDFHRAMVSAGEQSGRLDLMMERLATALEQEMDLRRIISRETWYPKLVVVVGLLALPLVDLVVYHDVRRYIHDAVLPLVGGVGIFLVLYAMTRWLSQFKTFYDALLATIPPFAGAVRMVALARFARVLSSLYAAGVSIPAALTGAANATGNAYLARRILSAIPALQGGHGIAESLMKTGVFPPLVISMLGTGEQTGSLDMTMDKVAEYYEQEAAVRMHQLGVALGTLLIIILGIMTLMFMIQFYTGYFNKMNDMASPDGP
jgi:type IV pilus assembly protein PilC